MKIVYYDGGVLTCSKICIYDDKLICDDIWEVPLVEVKDIVENDFEVESKDE